MVGACQWYFTQGTIKNKNKDSEVILYQILLSLELIYLCIATESNDYFAIQLEVMTSSELLMKEKSLKSAPIIHSLKSYQ